MNKIRWTNDEFRALQAIDKKSKCTVNVLKPGASLRLYEQGYVLKDSCGNIELSESGKELLSALRRIK
jgi:hypothetical protein